MRVYIVLRTTLAHGPALDAWLEGLDIETEAANPHKGEHITIVDWTDGDDVLDEIGLGYRPPPGFAGSYGPKTGATSPVPFEATITYDECDHPGMVGRVWEPSTETLTSTDLVNDEPFVNITLDANEHVILRGAPGAIEYLRALRRIGLHLP